MCAFVDSKSQRQEKGYEIDADTSAQMEVGIY